MKFIASKENMTGHFFTPKWADFLRRNALSGNYPTCATNTVESGSPSKKKTK